jgi:hypothetical protein
MNRIFEKYPWLGRPRNISIVFAGLVVAATALRLLFCENPFNNFSIIRFSFHNLLSGNDLYAPHPDHHWDLFKYSPTFSLLMAPFYLLPRWLGLLVFNLLNAYLPYQAICRLNIPDRAKAFILIFIAIELLTSIQNAQCNGIVAGIMIGVFAAFERNEVVLAALLVCLGTFIKVFPAVIGVLFLFYDRRSRFLLACAGWGLLLGLLPGLVTGPAGLVVVYRQWLHLLATDPTLALNYSVMTLTQRWFNFTAPDRWYLIPGLVLLLLPLARLNRWKAFSFRLVYLASLLVWVVIFNHKAESPTFVIAACGVAIWSLAESNAPLRTGMLWFVFVFTMLSPTELFPPWLRQHVWQPYCLKALPCIVAWAWIEWRLLCSKEVSLPFSGGRPVASG